MCQGTGIPKYQDKRSKHLIKKREKVKETNKQKISEEMCQGSCILIPGVLNIKRKSSVHMCLIGS